MKRSKYFNLVSVIQDKIGTIGILEDIVMSLDNLIQNPTQSYVKVELQNQRAVIEDYIEAINQLVI